MRITDNLYMLSGAAYGQVGNAYAVKQDEKLILIDSGKNAAALEIILENLRYHRLENYPVTHVLLTHKHQDHMGNAWYFRKQGAKILCSAIDADGVENGGVGTNDFGIDEFKTCQVDGKLNGGEVIDINGIAFKIILVPGHTCGSVFFLFVLDDRTLVATGDAVLPEPGAYDHGIEAALGWPGSYELDKKVYLQALERVLWVQADIMLGGHGIPVMMNGGDIIRKAFKRALIEFRC